MLYFLIYLNSIISTDIKIPQTIKFDKFDLIFRFEDEMKREEYKKTIDAIIESLNKDIDKFPYKLKYKQFFDFQLKILNNCIEKRNIPLEFILHIILKYLKKFSESINKRFELNEKDTERYDKGVIILNKLQRKIIDKYELVKIKKL